MLPGVYSTHSYCVILSFDTSSLPDGTTITGATLRIYRSSLQGSVSSLQIDIRSGHFWTSSAQALTDYSALASASNIANLSVPGANNQSAQAVLSSSALGYVNKAGRTQFRLKASSSANYASDVLTIYAGESATYSPVMIVTYQ